ncbi:MAG: dTDP-glucose 4,6-dehydratase [Candidatus Magasanikbacteria bacterium RIFOXYD2_FULL_39_9]|uniref:dTDP-glucose 4,6-dehydratase n=1 Tax=Candidatus Magasanikbacteria bacterium RIFOXYD1_FULL_40_23 TaxID=1798705 RepID=A0A1F6P9P5_9BACT|nr:MAG: dTDP-glucose 4,6-dehydratase [Candidatus Magasanikbacteria bacterium RIFOXYD2_FULL_39_9]OGH92886.1 MAG: dTDP-glucose 4,6-dehydratase [Candidatus Magasanikbacteria bacterium RIFOXYD1_FULL_40_23]
MRLLVSGGAGFMGSHFIKYILAKYPDYTVVNFDKLTYAGNLENLREVENNPHYKFVQGDICDREALEKVISENKIEAIVNYAAETHVDRSIMDPDAFLRTEIFGSFNLLEATKKFNLTKMVQVSTDEVYGSIEDGSFSEESSFSPNSPYAAAKAGADHLCRAYFVTYKTPVVVTHSCNFYGTNQFPEKLIPYFITNLIEGKKVPLYGDGKAVREWIHTSDHCRAIDVLLHKAAPGEVYNIGTGKELENIEITKMILSEMGLGEDMIEPVKDRPGHDRRYSIDCSKLSRDFGWKPEKDFATGLKETIEWYKANADWWQPLKSGEHLDYFRKQYTDKA